MRKIPEVISQEGLLVGWSLEPEQRKDLIGFSQEEQETRRSGLSLEPILDTGEGHLITVAPTGTGKGTGCIIPAMLRYNGPVIIVDPKGENYAVTARRRREMGQKVLLLDPFHITDSEDRQSFNPLDLADPSSDRFIEDVATLASLISVPHREVSGDYLFWDNMGTNLISAAIIDVLTMDDSSDATLTAVRSLIHSPLEKIKKRSEKWIKKGIPELKRLAALFRNPADETLGGYLAHAIRQLDFLKGERMQQHFSGSDIDLNEIFDGTPLTLYLVLPADKLESHASLLRLWIGVCITIITRRKIQPAKNTLLMVDEAAQLGTLPQLRQAITLLRGFGVRVWTFWQDISQIRNLYPRDWETIFNNCRVQQFFGATTGMAASAVAAVSGFEDEDEIMDLESDEMILNIPGDEPVVAAKPNYLRDSAFSGLYDPNPFYTLKTDPRAEALRTRPVFRKTRSPAALRKKMNIRQERVLADQMILPVDDSLWEEVVSPEREQRLGIAGIDSTEFLENPFIRLRRCKLSFYPDFDWYEITDTRKTPALYAYSIMNAEENIRLLGSSDPLHETNEKQLNLDPSNVVLYARFFCACICADEGRFLVIENPDSLEWLDKPEKAVLEELGKQIQSPRILETRDNGTEKTWIIETTLLHGTTIFTTRLAVTGGTGSVEMIDDQPVAGNLQVVPDLKRLEYIGAFDNDGNFQSIG